MKSSMYIAMSIFASALTNTACAATVSGSIKDAMGAAVGGALVIAVDNQTHETPVGQAAGPTQRADRFGTFQLTLTPGFYDLCAFSAGFTASCQKIYLPENSTALHRKIRLSIDPLVTKERGDVFQ